MPGWGKVLTGVVIGGVLVGGYAAKKATEVVDAFSTGLAGGGESLFRQARRGRRRR